MALATFTARGNTARPSRCSKRRVAIHRRLLTDDHPDTAQSYNNVAYNLNARGSTPAKPLYEKALEINRRLLTDDHPATATCYNNVAVNLYAQGKYAQAQPLYEKAWESIALLTDDHSNTALSYNNVAACYTPGEVRPGPAAASKAPSRSGDAC